MKLVIAEKPSVAQSIAKVIGATERQDGYLEGNGYIVSWCVGHLVELAEPEFYDEKYSKWRYEDLPILPKEWEYQVSESTRKQFKVLKDLMKRSDVTSLVEATDAGREGELIFRLVYHQAGCKKPFERLWISSMEDKAIEEGFANLKSGTEYDALYEAALCRERADWMVGMNATRLFSTLYGQTLNVGRVMTPTLAMLVTREAEISGFKPEPFYTIAITVGGVTATSERYSVKSEAEDVLQKVRDAGTAVIRKNRTTEKQEKAPQLYDLTNLQRDANKMLGFTAQQTLDYAQSLYETTDRESLVEWDYELNKLKPTEVSRNSAKRAWWKCRYGHSWSMKINERTVLGKGCRICEQEYLSLFPALAISYYANLKGLKVELGSDRLFGIPLDVYIPLEQVAIQVNTDSEKIDILKEHLCKQRGIKLIKLPMKPNEVEDFYERNTDSDTRTEYIKSIFNNDYTELTLQDGRTVGYKTFQNVLHLWEGHYDSRTAQSFYNWSVIAQHFEAMRLL